MTTRCPVESGCKFKFKVSLC